MLLAWAISTEHWLSLAAAETQEIWGLPSGIRLLSCGQVGDTAEVGSWILIRGSPALGCVSQSHLLLFPDLGSGYS